MSAPKGAVFELAVCVLGIYSCYLSYGIFQEKIFKYRDFENRRFESTLFLLCLQCICNAILAAIAGAIIGQNKTKKAIPTTAFATTAFCYLGAMLCSNEALKHVAYPTQALAKSCKMIPVMLMGVLLRGKKYSMKEYATVFVITAGIAIFQLGKLSKSNGQADSAYGLLLLALSLTLDGVTGPKQEILCATYKPTVHQQMFYTNAWAALYTFVGAYVLTSQWSVGIEFVSSNPELWTPMAFFGICSALGQNFIFYCIQRFSALTCTTITTTRKFFTILVSVALYGHVLSVTSWAGVVMVFAGLSVELSSKYQSHHKVK